MPAGRRTTPNAPPEDEKRPGRGAPASPQGEEYVSGREFTVGLIGNREPIVIGASNVNNTDDSGDLGAITTSLGFDGTIDEVAVFDGELDAQQVQQLVQFGAAGVVQ